jgi:hypothetical protein
MSRTKRLELRLTEEELARLDEARGGASRGGYLRALLMARSGADGVASGDEALALLSASARAGKVNAQIALARLLAVGEKPRAAASQDEDPFDAAADKRLRVVRGAH